MTEKSSARQRLHESIQQTSDTDEAIEDAMLMGWVVVAEWMDGDGERWITGLAGGNGGEGDLPIWQTQGYLWHSLNDWFGKEDEK